MHLGLVAVLFEDLVHAAMRDLVLAVMMM